MLGDIPVSIQVAYADYNSDPVPEKRLWYAVLCRALCDCIYYEESLAELEALEKRKEGGRIETQAQKNTHSAASDNKKAARAAMQWFLDGEVAFTTFGFSFEYVCEVLELNPKIIREFAKKVAKEGRAFEIRWRNRHRSRNRGDDTYILPVGRGQEAA